MDDFAQYLRLCNAALSGLLCGLCILRMQWKPKDAVRNTRILGLGFICFAAAWGSFGLRYIGYRPWLPFVTIGLLLSVYGMRRPAEGETQRKWD